MSDLENLKKQLAELIQSEQANARKQEEMNSTNKQLQGLHAQIQEAKDQLVAMKAESDGLRSRAAKDASEIISEANLIKADADAKLAHANMQDRNVAHKLQDAETLKAQYETLVSEISSQKEKLKAALAC